LGIIAYYDKGNSIPSEEWVGIHLLAQYVLTWDYAELNTAEGLTSSAARQQPCRPLYDTQSRISNNSNNNNNNKGGYYMDGATYSLTLSVPCHFRESSG
jgi:hypothetical protein